MSPDELEEIERAEHVAGLHRRFAVLSWLRDGAGEIAGELLEAAKRQAFWSAVAAGAAAVLGRLANRALSKIDDPGPAGVPEESSGRGFDVSPHETPRGQGVDVVEGQAVTADPLDELVDRANTLLDDATPLIEELGDEESLRELARARALLNGQLTPDEVDDIDPEALLEHLAHADGGLAKVLNDETRGHVPVDGCPSCRALSGHQLGCPLAPGPDERPFA
ncbi:MAG TPA: hypothetical protein VGX21_13170 [Methylomirabilota bacterium]|jgi:hypothetical protein|nr:hypothetical protein [Methylomirabilota bacterium]